MSAEGRPTKERWELQDRGTSAAKKISEMNEVLARKSGAQSAAWRLSTNR